MKFVLFHNAADDSYMNTVENFRGAYAATETVDIYFNAVGNLVEGIKEKDVVYYDKHAGHGIQHKNKFYGVIKQQDVVLID